jgi:hypothetical protein
MSAANLLSLFKIQYGIIFDNPTPIAEVLVTFGSNTTNVANDARTTLPTTLHRFLRPAMGL